MPLALRSLRLHPDTLLAELALGAAVGAGCGVGAAGFLHALAWATATRTRHSALVWALPAAGLLLGALLWRWFRPTLGGSGLVRATVAQASDGARPAWLPAALAPVVVGGTVLTHLFGGSAGREGTAVQLGAGVADLSSRALRLSPAARHRALVAGVAGGFGAVFGTPVAGVVFALEWVRPTRIPTAGAAGAILAALVGDRVAHALGAEHPPFPPLAPTPLTLDLGWRWLVFAAAVAGVVLAFIALTHGIKRRLAPLTLPLRLAVGGLAVVALWQLAGTDRYLGLGVPTIVEAFHHPLGLEVVGLKLLFTALTLGAGWLGGEVTPLFFLGASLGSALAGPLGLPLDLAAGVGLAAVFGVAAQTPLALLCMAAELLGAAALPHAALVLLVAVRLTGGRGIYGAPPRRP